MDKDTALRLALEALEYEAQKGSDNAYQSEREAIKAALEAKYAPVGDFYITKAMAKHIKNLEVDWNICTSGSKKPTDKKVVPVFVGDTTPPQRTWVKLTDEQFLEACKIAEGGNYMVAFQRIQQWLMENNI